ncbi:MAG TPA: plastocyanin/azurin family copper-binding protein [Acidimicrobiales bacterium]|nr:plastocyanin/azurin family copper-binding protein [Acidimicrobiales bacterium]
MLRRQQLVIGALAASAIVLGACGGDDDGGSSGDGLTTQSGGAGEVTVVAQDTLRFDHDSYSADAGEVTITYENDGSLVHTLLIDGVDDFKLQVSASGDTDSGTVDLEPGEYRIYCDVPGHSSMEATLTVE